MIEFSFRHLKIEREKYSYHWRCRHGCVENINTDLTTATVLLKYEIQLPPTVNFNKRSRKLIQLPECVEPLPLKKRTAI